MVPLRMSLTVATAMTAGPSTHTDESIRKNATLVTVGA